MTEKIERRHADDYKPRQQREFDVPPQHKGAVSKLFRDMSQVGLKLSYFDYYTALHDCEFDVDKTMDYLLGGQYKPWKFNANKAYGSHAEQQDMHGRRRFRGHVSLNFNDAQEEAMVEIADAEPERPAKFVTVVVDSKEGVEEKPKRQPKQTRKEKPVETAEKQEPAKKADTQDIVIEMMPEPKKAEKVERAEKPKKPEAVEKKEEPKREKKPRSPKKPAEAPAAVQEVKVEEVKVAEKAKAPEVNIEVVEAAPIAEEKPKKAEPKKVEEPKQELPTAQPMPYPYGWPYMMPYGAMMPPGMPMGAPMPMAPGMQLPAGVGMPPNMQFPPGMMPMAHGMPMPQMFGYYQPQFAPQK